MKTLLNYLFFFLLISTNLFGQTRHADLRSEKKEIIGFYICEIVLDSMSKYYHFSSHFFVDEVNLDTISILTAPDFDKIKRKIKNLGSKKNTASRGIYEFNPLVHDSSGNLKSDEAMIGTFYKNSSQKICVGYKLKTKAIVLSNIENRFLSIRGCNSIYKSPFIHFIEEIVQPLALTDKDLKKLSFTKTDIAKLPFLTCD